jgi:class 3 adenylate cyclase/tetratricopeptide (TPR) repeat protein
MRCGNCGTENEAGRKFCGECGGKLAVACPVCGTANPPAAKFCGECGSGISSSSDKAAPPSEASPTTVQPTAERRLVSVLFADLVGFTTLSENRDPEETRELLSRYFDRAREVIERYGGTVEKFIGDAVMAVWGAPVAHEDDAERAVRAGLELIDSISALGKEVGAAELRLRAGVLTGEAAVTVGVQGQGMVAGDLVNTASRLQSAAAPNTVLAGDATYRSARRAIAFEEAGDHTLKGKELPVKAYRALRVIAGHGGFRRAETLEPPFVGRDQELRVLKDALHTTGIERRPRLISIMGIAGIGKSRLAWEFFKYIDGLVETTFWHQGRCPAYGEGVTFWALGEMVRMRARITETEEAQSARTKLSETLEQHITDPKEQRWIEPRLAHLLGLEEGAPREREELFAAWRTFFERISNSGTTVLIFEDLQWADSGLIDFIEHTLEWARSSPILIVTLARPELMERRPTWGAGQRNFTSVHLTPLGDDEMRKLLGGLATGLPDFLVDQVVERSEGVPLYAVEMVRMLVDQGHLAYDEDRYRLITPPDHLDVPETLHALIASRLDGLSTEDKTLLQDASVLGKTFPVEALAAIRVQEISELKAALQLLVRKELLVVEGDPWSPERGQYGFVQSLIREVAYGTLARPERKSRHLAAASYYEAMGDELASVVASHLIEAQQASTSATEAEELALRARVALRSAAGRASSLGSPSQALVYLERALGIPDEPAERAVTLEKAAESALDSGAHGTADRYAMEAVDAYKGLSDLAGMARAGALLGAALVDEGRTAVAVDRMREILDKVSECESEEAVATLLLAIAAVERLAGHPKQALQTADRASLLSERLGDTRILTGVLSIKGSCLHASGREHEAILLLEGAVKLGAKYGHLKEQAFAAVNLSDALLLSDPSEALRVSRSVIDLARTIGNRTSESIAVLNACEAAISTGDWDWIATAIDETASERLPEFDRAWISLPHVKVRACRGNLQEVEHLLSRGKPLIEAADSPQDLANLRETTAMAALAANHLQDALDNAGEAVAAAPTSTNGTRSYLVAGRAALWLGDRMRAEQELRRLSERHLHTPWLDSNRLVLEAGLHLLDGKTHEAVDRYRDAAQSLRDLSCPFDVALSELDFVILAPDDPKARAAAEEARKIFEQLGAKPFLERLEAALSSSKG